MRDYQRYAARITEQIFEQDNAFFLESGVSINSGKAFVREGIYAGIRYNVTENGHGQNGGIIYLEITLEASDLYTVVVHRMDGRPAPNVLDMNTRKPVTITACTPQEVKIERVFAFDLIEVLHALFYRGGKL